jgi:hypothetical protein
MYINIIILVLCLNFALGLGHIPNTPITIPDAYEKCFLEYDNVQFIQLVNGTYVPVNTGAEIAALQQSLNNTGYDPITENIESVYQAGVTVRNFLLGGYIVNVIDNISFSCELQDTNENGQLDPVTEDNPGGDQYMPVQSDVWAYFTGGIQIIFGFMLVLVIFYIVTGKSLGYNL